jgi:hypothetical protein
MCGYVYEPAPVIMCAAIISAFALPVSLRAVVAAGDPHQTRDAKETSRRSRAAGPPARLISDGEKLYLEQNKDAEGNITKSEIPQLCIDQSSVLQDLLTTPGETKELPFARAIFQAWIDGVLEEDERGSCSAQLVLTVCMCSLLRYPTGEQQAACLSKGKLAKVLRASDMWYLSLFVLLYAPHCDALYSIPLPARRPVPARRTADDWSELRLVHIFKVVHVPLLGCCIVHVPHSCASVAPQHVQLSLGRQCTTAAVQ